MTKPAMLQCRRDGFTLVEVMVAIIILGIVLVSLAGVTFRTAQHSTRLQAANVRQGLLLQEVNRLTVTPWASLPGQVGCTTISAANLQFQRCITVATVTSNSRRVTVSIRHAWLQRPDSVSFLRANPPMSNPLSL